jgi:hypothetical protein
MYCFDSFHAIHPHPALPPFQHFAQIKNIILRQQGKSIQKRPRASAQEHPKKNKLFNNLSKSESQPKPNRFF